MKINGITGTFIVPNINKRTYNYVKFDATLENPKKGAIPKTVTVRTALESAWTRVVQRSNTKSCNECFRQLIRRKTLAEILAEGDLVLHLLKPKPGYSDDDVPDGNAAGRDIGLRRSVFFDSDPLT